MRHFIFVPCVLAIHLVIGSSVGWTDDESSPSAEVVLAKGEEAQTDIATLDQANTTGEAADSDVMLCSGCDDGCDGCATDCDACDPCATDCDGCATGCDDCGGCDSGYDACQTMPGEITERIGCGGCDGCGSELSRLDLKSLCPPGSTGCDECCDTCSCFRPGRLIGGILCKPCGSCDGCCDSGCCQTQCCKKQCCNYASFFGGWNVLHDYDGMTVAPPTNLRGTFSDGWGFGLACGRRLRNCYRAELEFSYRRNTGENWVINGVPGRWSGDFNSYAGMANLYRDIPALDLYGCTPYVGGGIGFASLRSSLNTAATTILIDDFAFAFQFMAGSTKTIGERVDLFTEYRYFAPTDVGVTNIGVIPAVVLDDDRFDNHGLFFGLRYHY